MAEGMQGYSIRGKDVWKSYDGEHYVLKALDFEFPERALVLIQGRSGSGKTTLLSLLGCIDTPTRGAIFLNGFDTANLSQKELADVRLRKVGIVFQTHNLIDDLTVEENVLLPLKIAKDQNGKKRAMELLETFEILDIKDKMPNEISGGERQRVAVARAMANNPTIILADEPTASLDLENCQIVIDTFKKVRELFNTTVIIASHDPLMDEHVQKVCKLHNGTLEELR